MDANGNSLETLLERVELFAKTNAELIKLKFVDKVSDVTSSVLSRLIAIVVFTFFVLNMTVALALWLGELLGRNYYGFLIVAAAYGLLGVILLLTQVQIKRSLNNSIIKKMLD